MKSKCIKVHNEISELNEGPNLQTNNDGISIRIRGDPGGRHWRTWKPNTFMAFQERNVIEDSFCNKTVTEDQYLSIYKSSYRSFNYSRPLPVCDNDVSRPSFTGDNYFSNNLESPLSDTEIQFSSITRSNSEKEATPYCKSSFESTSRKRFLRVLAPPVNQTRTNTIRSGDAFSSNCESTVSDKEIPYATFIRSKAEKEAALRNSFCDKPFAEDQHPSVYKSSYINHNYSRSSFRSDDAFSSNCESTVSDKEIETFVRPKAEKEATLRSKSSFEPTLRKSSLHVYDPPVKQSRTNAIQDSFGNKTFTEDQSTYKSPYSNAKYSRPSNVCENSFSSPSFRGDNYFSSNGVSTVSDNEIQFTIFIRSKAKKEATLRSKIPFAPTFRKTSLCVYDPPVNQRRTNAIQDSFCDKPFAEDQHPSVYKSSYINHNYSRSSFRSDDAFSSNCESTVSDKEIQFATFVRSKAEKEATIRSKSSIEPTLRKHSLPVYEPPVKQRRTNAIQDSFCNKPFAEDQQPNTYKASYDKDNYSRPSYVGENALLSPSFRGDNYFSSNSESTVSDKKFQFATFIRTKAEKEATLRRKSSFEPTFRKRSLRVYNPPVKQRRTNAIQDSFGNKTMQSIIW
ncbi:unnamed protein product [Mytilus coruscus]|uniref:Uncharacterized protein n=1 Tax=Mytilus coruscus TaxID=42192 RepID=A0A6J8CDF1_MYTCO|nr:unnamed protein product [Mytilus coruscus]